MQRAWWWGRSTIRISTPEPKEWCREFEPSEEEVDIFRERKGFEERTERYKRNED